MVDLSEFMKFQFLLKVKHNSSCSNSSRPLTFRYSHCSNTLYHIFFYYNNRIDFSLSDKK